jgi:uncharacterized protein
MWSFGIVLDEVLVERALQALAGQDPDMLVWWGSQLECVSALTRLERAVALDAKAVATSFERLKQLADSWHELKPGGIVRESAVRFLRVSFVGGSRCSTTCGCLRRSRARPPSLQFVTLDERLAGAARQEGFELVDIAAG